MNSIERDFCDYLKILSDFSESTRFIVAFSGGNDSLALLSLCVETVGVSNIVPVYVNHNIRSAEELEDEIKLNRENCLKLGLELIVREIPLGTVRDNSKHIGIEAAARKYRYQLLEEERINNHCDYILTAHHREDQVETVLMKIMAGSPVSGLRGISEKWNRVLRPLLPFSKDELKEYLAKQNLICSEDSTNSNSKYRRNEIRNEILPALKKIMPDCEQRILRIRNIAVGECLNVPQFDESIGIEVFRTLNSAQKSLVLYDMWDKTVGGFLPQTLIDRVVKNTDIGLEKKESANGGTFYTYNGTLYLYDNLKILNNGTFCLEFNEDYPKYNLPFSLQIEKKTTGKETDISIDFSKFRGKPVVRFAQSGERIKLKDGSKSVNRLLQDMKIPDFLRNRVPVISDDDGLCVVFGSVYGGKDRICAKMRSSLALNNYYKYICYKGN